MYTAKTRDQNLSTMYVSFSQQGRVILFNAL